MIFYSSDGGTDFFDDVTGVLQEDTLAPFFFLIGLDYMLRTNKSNKKKMVSHTKKKQRSS